MSNDAAVAVAFVAVLACIVNAVMMWRDKLHGLALLYIVLGAIFAYALTQTPAPQPLPQAVEEPTPWPTMTEGSGWKDFYDALVVTDTQLDYRISAHETAGAAPTNPSATPVSSPVPTVTPTAVSKACWACTIDSECAPGLRCYACGDHINRCVRSSSPNGDCTNCRNAGR